eukprot:COSAG02_NODE_834_length_16653_cov_9.111977_5_plen_526_part_00
MDQDIESFLASFGLETLANSFRENEFDTVRDLHEAEVESSDLAELGVAALKKRKLVLKAVAAAAAGASLTAASSPTPAAVLQPEQEPRPGPAADRRGGRQKATPVCTAARIQQLSQPKSPKLAATAPARRQPTPTGAAAAVAAADLLHGTLQERREQQQREMQERLEFQRSLKQVSLLGRFPAERGKVALTSAEELDRQREERAWARQEEWAEKQARRKTRNRRERTAAGGGGSCVVSTRRLEELAKSTTAASEVWRAQKQEEGYAAVEKQSIHAPDKQKGVDVSVVVGRLYSPSSTEKRKSVASTAKGLPAWGSPSASQARADRPPGAAARRKGKAKCEPSLAEEEALSRLQRSTRSSLANDKSQGRRKRKSRPTPSHQLDHLSSPQVPMLRVKGRTKVRTPSGVEEAEPPEISKLHAGVSLQHEAEAAAEAEAEGEAEAEAEAEIGVEVETAPEPEPKPESEPEPPANEALAVEVPSGVHAGDTISIEMPDGREIDVEIPEGLKSGDEFEVELDGLGVGIMEE